MVNWCYDIDLTIRKHLPVFVMSKDPLSWPPTHHGNLPSVITFIWSRSLKQTFIILLLGRMIWTFHPVVCQSSPLWGSVKEWGKQNSAGVSGPPPYCWLPSPHPISLTCHAPISIIITGGHRSPKCINSFFINSIIGALESPYFLNMSRLNNIGLIMHQHSAQQCCLIVESLNQVEMTLSYHPHHCCTLSVFFQSNDYLCAMTNVSE